jgi:glycosyltransferase involved in cell wall biosynthesis
MSGTEMIATHKEPTSEIVHEDSWTSDRSSVRKTRVCHVSVGLRTGGLERLLVDFARFHDAERFELTFVALDRIGRPAEEIRELGCEVVVLPDFGNSWKQLWSMRTVFRERNIDVVHTHNAHPHFWGTWAAWLAGVPVTMTTRHGQRFGQSLSGRTKFWLASQFAQRVVTVSEDAARLCLKEDGLSARRVRTIWNGIDSRRFEYRGPASEPRCISVARLSAEKDFPTLLRAIDLARREVPGLRLSLVGDGAERTKLEQLVRELNLREAVEFLGERSDIPDLLGKAGFFVSSSLTEGISLTLLEAMAVGLPVLATAVGGNPEIIEEGETGLLVPSESPERLAEGIVRMWTLRNQWRRMGRNGRKRVEENFDVRRMVAKYEAEYAIDLFEAHGRKGAAPCTE